MHARFFPDKQCKSIHLTFQVLPGSAATDLRRGENFNTFLFRNSLLYTVVKKFAKISQYLSELSKK